MRHGIGWMLQIGVRALWATAVRPPWSTGYAAAFSGADYARPARAPEGHRSRLTPSGPSATCRTALVAVVAPRMSHGRLACLPRCLSATPLSAGEPPAQWLVTTDRWGNPAYRLLSLPDSQDPAPTWQVRPLGARLGPSRGTAEAGYATQQHPWGHSSAGRARRSHRRGQEFDPPWLHHYSKESHLRVAFFLSDALQGRSRALGIVLALRPARARIVDRLIGLGRPLLGGFVLFAVLLAFFDAFLLALFAGPGVCHGSTHWCGHRDGAFMGRLTSRS